MIATLAVSVILAVCAWYLSRRRPPLSHLPGPRGWPVVGNMLQLDRLTPHITISDWAKRYGDIFTIRFFDENVVVLSSYETISEMLVKKGSTFAGRDTTSYRAALFGENGGGIGFGQPSEGWKELKKGAIAGIKLYTDEGRSRMEGILSEQIEETLTKLSRHQGDGSFDIADDLYDFGIKSILTIIIGQGIEDESPHFATIKDIDRASAEVLNFGGKGSELDLLPWLRFFGNSAYKKLRKIEYWTEDFWNAVYPNLRERFDKQKEPDCVVHHLLEAVDSKQFPDLNLARARVATKELVTAGSTTTVTSLYDLFSILLHYPKVKSRLKEEIDKEVGQSRKIRLEDQSRLPYAQATILEMLRYTSISPFGLPHIALTTATISGHAIPNGTTLLANLWFLHHDESFWNDPWTFRPDRFLDDEGRLVPPDHENRKHLMPFGAGIRVCPGEALAFARMFLLVTSVLQRFDIEPGDKDLVPCDPRTYELGLALKPKPYTLKVIAR